jgi:hypothetical protein
MMIKSHQYSNVLPDPLKVGVKQLHRGVDNRQRDILIGGE